MKFERQIFTTDVTLDYNDFIDCTIKDCAVMYFGGKFSLERTTFTNVRFGVGGAAHDTLAFLRLVRANGPNLLDDLLNQGAQPSPEAMTIN